MSAPGLEINYLTLALILNHNMNTYNIINCMPQGLHVYISNLYFQINISVIAILDYLSKI